MGVKYFFLQMIKCVFFNKIIVCDVVVQVFEVGGIKLFIENLVGLLMYMVYVILVVLMKRLICFVSLF